MFQNLWKTLSERQQEILAGRFGLDKFKTPQTLAALGDRYGITRERVRQIEANALKTLHQKLADDSSWTHVFTQAKKYLKNLGGTAKQEDLVRYVQTFAKDLTPNQVALVISASAQFHLHPETEEYRSFYYADKPSLQRMTQFVDQWVKFLNTNKDEALEGKYQELFKRYIKSKGVPQAQALNYLDISKHIHVNPYGDVGLAQWAEIKPLTIRDRIYLVLKKQGKPLHFETIAKTINQAGFDARTALAPTVHNELIKDTRFILVGRGMYGLSEHGYQAGTAREVIHRILKHKGPMKAREIIQEIQKERFLKPNTVLVNLQNKSYFQRLSDGTYTVRES